MKQIVSVTLVTPTEDNYKAASALPYHLIKYRPKDIKMVVYTFNLNGVSDQRITSIARDMDVEIKILEAPQWVKYMMDTPLRALKRILAYPYTYYYKLTESVISQIKSTLPDGIWMYGDGLAHAMRQFTEYKCVLTMPDCVPLYYHRLMGDAYSNSCLSRLLGNAWMYHKNINMEKNYPHGTNIHYHLVGEADKEFLRKICPGINAHFIRHPHYNITTPKTIAFSQPKIKLLLAGQYNLYMQTAFDEALPALLANKELAQHYQLTFLGRGWEQAMEKLKAVGYECRQLTFVDVYLDEIIKYDIQWTPISVGTGTKGKVLDALSNGLLLIGTPYALENIAVRDRESCMLYETPDQLIACLKEVVNNPKHYVKVAEAGRTEILSQHDRAKVSAELFSLFDN